MFGLSRVVMLPGPLLQQPHQFVVQFAHEKGRHFVRSVLSVMIAYCVAVNVVKLPLTVENLQKRGAKAVQLVQVTG